MKFHPALLALALGAFGIGLTEFAPMGLLPVIADDLHVSIPVGGLLISAYAIGVVVGAPLMTLTTVRVPRRGLLIGLSAIFTLGNVLAALSHGYGMLIGARVVTSFNHGAFFGVGAIVAASLVTPEKRASAVATMFMGLPAASIVGLPLTTWAGAQFGWRPVFWAIAGMGLVTMAALSLTLPRQPTPRNGGIGAELRVLLRSQVLAALALTTIGFSAMFTVFTYIVPILQTEAHASLGFITGVLMIFGLASRSATGLAADMPTAQ
jgi:MFS transporter, DHA1 family, inner membrane transport protein